MSTGKSASIPAPTFLTALYFGGVMDGYDANDPAKVGRDRFILAKGHAAPALYAALAHAGFFPTDELHTLRKLGTRLQGHPDSNLLPGVEAHRLARPGAFRGRGPCGRPASDRRGRPRLHGARRWRVRGGQVWERPCSPPAKLGRLVAIIDNNELQIDGCIHDVCDPGDLGESSFAFGWDVQRVCGDIPALIGFSAASRPRRPIRPVRCSRTRGEGQGRLLHGKSGRLARQGAARGTEKALAELSADAE